MSLVLVTGGSGFVGSYCILHVASPIAVAVPEHEDELIVPARMSMVEIAQVLKARRESLVRLGLLKTAQAA